MIDTNKLKRVVENKLKDSLFTMDDKFKSLRSATVSEPILVHSFSGFPEYYFIPLLIKDHACGFAHADLQGNVGKIGIFGSNNSDEKSWIPLSFFSTPPEQSINEIVNSYPGHVLTDVTFSCFRSPNNFGWRIKIKDAKKIITSVMVSPNGWFTVLNDS